MCLLLGYHELSLQLLPFASLTKLQASQTLRSWHTHQESLVVPTASSASTILWFLNNWWDEEARDNTMGWLRCLENTGPNRPSSICSNLYSILRTWAPVYICKSESESESQEPKARKKNLYQTYLQLSRKCFCCYCCLFVGFLKQGLLGLGLASNSRSCGLTLQRTRMTNIHHPLCLVTTSFETKPPFSQGRGW